MGPNGSEWVPEWFQENYLSDICLSGPVLIRTDPDPDRPRIVRMGPDGSGWVRMGPDGSHNVIMYVRDRNASNCDDLFEFKYEFEFI